MDFKSALSNIKASNATAHWLLQRITSILLIPLSYWLIALVNLITAAPYQTTVDWLSSPPNALALSAWLIIVFYHAAQGLQVVIEDYVPTQPFQTWSIRAVNGICGFLALIAVAAILKIIL